MSELDGIAERLEVVYAYGDHDYDERGAGEAANEDGARLRLWRPVPPGADNLSNTA